MDAVRSDEMTFDEFKSLVVGKRIVDVIENADRLYDNVIAVDEFVLEGGVRIPVYGQAD